MQTLDVISVNIWQILISLANLVLLFFLFKKFLYQPVKKILKQRQDELDSHYMSAEQAEAEAEKNRRQWEETVSGAGTKADEIMQVATDNAKRRSEEIINEARTQAEGILRRAEQDAALEREKAIDSIRREIVEVSGILSEKLLEREINTEDHRNLIDSFIEGIGEDHE